MKVFLSSTYVDLTEYRKAAAEALERLGQQVGRMEVFGARPKEPSDACLGEIEDCDLFVGIYAHRYGYIPDRSDTSITEAEFRHARKCNKPIFCFVLDDEYPWPPKMIEGEPGRNRLTALKAEISSSFVWETFTTSKDLAYKIAASIGRYLTQTSSTKGPPACIDISGKWRADQTEETPITYFDFKVVDDKLYGTVWIPPSFGMQHSESAIHNGQIIADRVSFTTKHECTKSFGSTTKEETRGEFITSYQGQMKGDEIHFARQVEGYYSEITAKRIIDLTEVTFKPTSPEERSVYALLYTLPGHEGGVRSLSFGPTRGTYRSGGIRLASGGAKDGKIDYWDVAMAEARGSEDFFESSQGGAQVHVAYSPRTREKGVDLTAVGVTKDGHLMKFFSWYFWPAGGTGGGGRTQEYLGLVGPVGISGNSYVIATAETDETSKFTINIRNTNGDVKRSLSCEGSVSALALDLEGNLLASTEAMESNEATIKMWDTSTGAIKWRITSRRPVNRLAISPDANLLASGGAEDCQIRIWDTSNGSLKFTLNQEGDSRISYLTFGNTESLLASAGFPSGVVNLWNTSTGELDQALDSKASVGALAFSPDDRLLASGDTDNGSIMVWAKPKKADTKGK